MPVLLLKFYDFSYSHRSAQKIPKFRLASRYQVIILMAFPDKRIDFLEYAQYQMLE